MANAEIFNERSDYKNPSGVAASQAPSFVGASISESPMQKVYGWWVC
jgi:hypothetical protein